MASSNPALEPHRLDSNISHVVIDVGEFAIDVLFYCVALDY